MSTKQVKQVGMSDEELKAKIGDALKSNHPCSLTELGRLLGWKKISGSQTKRIRAILPGLEELLKKNVALKELKEPKIAPKPKSAGKKDAKAKPVKATGNHVEGNPYRPGSNYALVYDCLVKMGKDKPVSRKDLLAQVCKLSGKDEKHAGYDLAVVLSPSKEGTFHKSATKASLTYFVERLENGMVRWHSR